VSFLCSVRRQRLLRRMKDEPSGETQRQRRAREPDEASGGALTTHGVPRCLTEDEPALRRNGRSQVTPHTRQTCVPRQIASRSSVKSITLDGDGESLWWGRGHLDTRGGRKQGKLHVQRVSRHWRIGRRGGKHTRRRGAHAWARDPHEGTTTTREGDEPREGPQG
jgi:hypothetical protein